MTQHTPGPWTTEPTTDFGAAIRVMDEQDVTIALCYQQPLDTWTAEATAQLIAAAPDILALLKHAQHFIEPPGDFAAHEHGKLLDDIDAVRAKVEGKDIVP